MLCVLTTHMVAVVRPHHTLRSTSRWVSPVVASREERSSARLAQQTVLRAAEPAAVEQGGDGYW